MGVRILIGSEQGAASVDAVLFDSVSEFAFGPVFHESPDASAEEMAEQFLAWLDENDHGDARSLSDNALEGLYDQWLEAREGTSG